jgi:glycosyltransferase involved in cell wall biosynthesis
LKEDRTKISALLITYNEVNHIDEVITNIGFADEIIVVDSFSTDGTLDKLKALPHVKVIQRPFRNFSDQRNFAISMAKHYWILFIDADERIKQRLKDEIIETINKPTDVAGFMIKRKFFFNDKFIRFSGFQTDTTYRLFKNGYVKYQEDKFVHEMPIVDGTTKVLDNYMIHYSFTTNENYKAKMEHYASLKALELFKKGKRPNKFHFFFRPTYKFLVNYFFRLGILDGIEGFNLCYLSAYGVYYRYRELNRLFRNSPK